MPPTTDEMLAKWREVIGWTDTSISVGHIQRNLPRAHPVNQNWVCYECSVAPVAYTKGFTVGPADPDDRMEAVPLEPAVTWDSYQFDLTFGPKTYSMIGDSLIEREDSSYVDENMDVKPYSWFPLEWFRYTVFKRTPREEYLRKKQGQSRYRRATDVPPNKTVLPDYPRLLLPDSVVTVTVFDVPARFVMSADSLLERWRNYVNQFTMWGLYPPGSILYRGYKELARVNPPFADEDEDFPGIFTASPVLDLELEFWLTRRTPTDPPTPSNPNYIASQGWNCWPHEGSSVSPKGFFYATKEGIGEKTDATGTYTAGDELTYTPFFYSAPLNALLVDPDAGLFP